MRVQRWAWLLSAGAGALAFLVLLWLLSPWFLWHLLPEQTDFKAVLKSDRRIAALVPGLQVVEPLLGSSAQIGVATTSNSQTTFIIRPTVAGYFSLRHELAAAGWQTYWYGPWLIAGDGGLVEHRSFWQAARGGWQARLPDGQGYNPLFIAEGKLPGLDKPVRAVATAVGPEWRIMVSKISSEEQQSAPPTPRLRRTSLPDRPPQPISEAMAELSLTGAMLGELPEPLKEKWDEKWRELLGFTRTKPDFITELTHYPQVQLTIRAAGARLAVFEENERWQAAVRRWVEEEERQFRIQKRSFRLPDGTLGAEYVPGPRQALFTVSAAHPTCSEATVQERYFWLCGDDYSFFASSEDLLATVTPPTKGEISLGENFLPVVAEKKLRAATVVISTNQILIRLLWAAKR